MIEYQTYIEKYDWYITVYYDVTCNDTKEIIEILNFLNIGESLKLKVEENIQQCLDNVGFTYTNMNLHESIIVIGTTSSYDEFMNSLTHENMHACIHIMDAYGISPYGEEPCYLMGELIQQQVPIIKKFVCKH